MKEQLFTDWHPMRWVALIFGIGLGLNWLINTAPLSGFLSLFFLFQAITNTGCLAGRCAPELQSRGDSDISIDDIEFEEIKTEK
ncbi:MAG: hypothetical protein EA359_04215 [Balneolaceae bacterium]|jgi:hypothetical protein|nr:MAG: hypothetical protein EA359_04215 [Balneolaceae bacterium]